MGDDRARGECRQEPAPADRLGRGVRGERDPERVQRFVVPPHADPLPHLLQQGDGDKADERAEPGAEQEESHRVPAQLRRSTA